MSVSLVVTAFSHFAVDAHAVHPCAVASTSKTLLFVWFSVALLDLETVKIRA